jgi:hypothetical protein
VIVLAFAVLLLPGLAWWAWLGRRREDPLVALSQMVGVGLAVIILVAQVGFIVGVRLTRLYSIILLAIFALLAFDGLLRKRIRFQRRYHLHLLIGLFLVGGAIAWRLYQARELLLPNWVDGQHHYLIVRALIEAGGLPHDLSPYLPVPFYYHYGFHALAALFTAVSGLSIGESMLVLAQVLNAAVGLSVYALGKAVWRNWRPALAAALLVSFATRMPAYYLSWGRYTLITGLVLLPLAMAQAIDITRGKNIWRSALTLSLLTAGLLLSHYFAALLLAVFLGVLALVTLIQDWRCFPQAFMRVSGVVNSAGIGLLLAAPWLWRVAQFSASNPGVETRLPESLDAILTSGRVDYIWELLGPVSNHWLLLPAGLGLLLVLFKRHSLSFGLWSLGMALMTLPWGLTVRPFRADHFAIVLFLPVTLLAGGLFWGAASWAGKRLKRRWVTVALLVLVAAGWTAWGFPKTRDVINPVTVLVTPADIDALDWVAENTPEGARFFINTAYWLNNVYRGVDGGGWLLPYTGRWGLVPTVFYGFSPDRAWNETLRGWGQAASEITTCSDEFWALVEEAELGWVYLRTGVGSLQPGGLAGCVGVEAVYEDGGVAIYRVMQP